MKKVDVYFENNDIKDIEENHTCNLANGFTFFEKVFAQVTFSAFWIIGFLVIFHQNVYWALAYAVFVAYGVLGIVQRHLVCPRCPHLHQYADCLQLHPKLTKMLVKKPTSRPMNRIEKGLFLIIMLGLFIFPQYWLVKMPMYLVIFWVFGGAWYLSQWFYFCKRCRVKTCPFNRVKKEVIYD